MKSLRRATRAARSAVSNRGWLLLIAALLTTFMPSLAMANEGEGIVLNFDSTGKAGLIFALVIAILALLIGAGLWSWVMGQSPGDEKMQDVASAIKQGALAYLKKQISTMAIFIVLLFAGLVGLYWRLGAPLAFGIAGCFVAGVTASYISGFAGMRMAVEGNARTANAALTSYRRSFVIAFRSGAFAGLITVGMGLLGASVIVLAFPSYAPNLLIGFGFGASLAALFMRVGGGIFTKAADVGADLVGKVEAGIPEDDPRNPATIADNVGDNVGDCAGMAADVFESFEVTLVASIVLSAATAAVFDAQTWPRLIVFGLGACALGLLASVISIFFVQGSDDLQSDPFKLLNRGFNISRLLCFVMIGVLAYLFMGGKNPIQTTRLVAVTQYQNDKIKQVQAIQADLAQKANKQPYEITAAQVIADPRAKDMQLDPKQDLNEVTQWLQVTSDQLPKPVEYSGATPVTDYSATNIPVLGYAVQGTPQPGQPPGYQTLGAALKSLAGTQLIVAEYSHIAHRAAVPAVGNRSAQPAQDINEVRWLGPVSKKLLDQQITMFQQRLKQMKADESINILKTYPATLYVTSDGTPVWGIDGEVSKPEELRAVDAPSSYYAASPDTVNSLIKNASPTSPPMLPKRGNIDVAMVNHEAVPWWTFWITIGFGIAMAFAIELITDYFVSVKKGPVREIAGVSTAGPAPMIIQGFAHGLTSSVFMLLAIVVALIFPLFVFSPSHYGGYILSFYGIALVGVGLLTSTAYVLAMDTFGPISDNAQGVFEMSGAAETHPEAAAAVGRLDAAGNTTKALTKGFAIATAVVAAVALFHSYLDGANLQAVGLRLDVPEIFLGLLIGGAAPYLFSAFAINAVGRSSFQLINEVRRQFRNDPGIMQGTSKPDYARCVAIVTAAAQKELLSPGILAIALPAAVGFGFSIGKPTTEINGHLYNLTGAEALGGFLAGAIVSGQLMAVLLANSGAMWDNAKKLIEDGLYGGKGSDAHKAAVVGDTIGDPFKDTAGPALNPLIKVMNLVGLLLSGVVILPLSTAVLVTITVICLLALAISITLSRRGSMSEALSQVSQEGTAVAVPAPAAIESPSVDVAEPVAPSRPATKKLFVEEPDDKTE